MLSSCYAAQQEVADVQEQQFDIRNQESSVWLDLGLKYCLKFG